jgi:predicted alpha-1,2-mannosidase
MKGGCSVELTDPTRRTFLKATGLAMLASAVPADAAVIDEPSHARTTESGTAPRNLMEMVNLLQGTDSTSYFSRGNTLPISAMPFGMAHWTMQSRASTPWMFQPGDRRIHGFRCTHQLSPWLGDYGQAVFLPFSGDINSQPEARAASWRPDEAKLYPHSMRLRLERYQVNIELIPSERCALLTADFDGKAAPGFLIELPGKAGEIAPTQAERTIRFHSKENRGGVPEGFATYYVLRFHEPWENIEIKDLRGGRVAIVRFPSSAGNRIIARIGTSFISYEQAERNLQRELGERNPEQVRAAAEAEWNAHLSRIEVQGGSEEQQRTFYSCMYRALLFPRTWHEPDESGNPRHYSAFNGKVMPGVMYADHGYWDVYRAWYPLMTIVFPERLGEIMQAWVNAYKEGGWLPQFPAPGYRACMSGSLIDSIFADAAVKGIPGFDLEMAYEGLKKHATTAGDPGKGFGRQGIEYYLRHNYLPANRVEQSVAETADAAYGDFCIGEVARVLGKEADAEMFHKRSQNWRHIFDTGTGFLRGKNENGSWLEPFDPFQWGSPYEEGAAWQHRWDVPHDIPGLVELLGGPERTAAILDEMLALPPKFGVGVYGQEIHEMSEMAAINFGQYSHNNQPVHHVLYIYAAAGRPDRTRYWVRRVLSELYSSEKFSGDEDTGSMAAWFILSSLGLYQLCPGKPEYTLGVPLFDRVVLHLPGDKSTVIAAQGQSPNGFYVSSVLLDEKPFDSPTLRHVDLIRGIRLEFRMR